MKKIKLIMLSALISLLGFSLAFAATSALIDVSAEVPNNSPNLVVDIMEADTEAEYLNPYVLGTRVTALDFGPLTFELTGGGSAGVWYSPKAFFVFIFTNGFGHRYEVKSTCSGLTSGGNVLPAGSFGLTPGYQKEDKWVFPGGELAQGDQPTGSDLGAAGPGIATDKLIYRSEPAGSARIIRAVYGLPPFLAGGADPFPGYTPIPLTQPNGTYSAQVTITITQI